MARKPEPSPKFFKVMVKDFTRKLCLPPFFSQKWGEILPVNAKLRNNCETWNVKLEKESDEKFYFTGGWTKFTEDLGIKMGEFLVFRFIGNRTFDVTVYGIGGCVRKRLHSNCPAKDSTRDARGSGSGVTRNIKVEVNSDEDGSEVMSFSKKMKKYDMFRLYIPKSFALATGITRKKSINLQDSKCRNWPVEIKAREDHINSFSMAEGWTYFLQGNKIVLGSTVFFEYVKGSGNSIKVTVVENRKNGTRSTEKGKRRSKFAEDYNRNGAGITGSIKVEANNDHEDVTDPKDGSAVASFSREIKHYVIYSLQIPKWFALATGIGWRKAINLLDSKGRTWPVEMVTRLGDMNLLSITTGWNDFLIGNKVVIGSTVLFEYVKGSGNTIKATIIENGKNGKELIRSTKGRPKLVRTSTHSVFF